MGKENDIMLSGKALGFKYATEEDMKKVCNKCKQAYYGDFLPQDCEVCTFKQAVDKLRTYAWELAMLYE